jgi:hypothetical protein
MNSTLTAVAVDGRSDVPLQVKNHAYIYCIEINSPFQCSMHWRTRNNRNLCCCSLQSVQRTRQKIAFGNRKLIHFLLLNSVEARRIQESIRLRRKRRKQKRQCGATQFQVVFPARSASHSPFISTGTELQSTRSPVPAPQAQAKPDESALREAQRIQQVCYVWLDCGCVV